MSNWIDSLIERMPIEGMLIIALFVGVAIYKHYTRNKRTNARDFINQDGAFNTNNVSITNNLNYSTTSNNIGYINIVLELNKEIAEYDKLRALLETMSLEDYTDNRKRKETLLRIKELEQVIIGHGKELFNNVQSYSIKNVEDVKQLLENYNEQSKHQR